MIKIFARLVLILTFIPPFVWGQDQLRFNTTLETINGDKINGYLKFRSLPEHITVFYPSGDSLNLDISLVRSVYIHSDQTLPVSEGLAGPDKWKSNFKPAYFNNTMFGILSGKSNEDDPPLASLTLETVNGIRLYRYLAFGMGIGYDQYNTTAVLPFFLSVRGDILPGWITLFYFVDAGYGPAWDSREDESNWEVMDTEGGFMFHTGAGLKIYGGPRLNVVLALGYKHQEVEYSSADWWGGTRVTDRSFNRMSFRLGIGF